MRITRADVVRAAAHLGIGEPAFRSRYVATSGDRLIDAPGARCPFLEDGRTTACRIYAARPGQCRAFFCGVLEAVLDGTRNRAWGEARIEAMRHLLAGLDAVLPGEGALYGRAAAYLEDAGSLPDDARIRARIAVFEEMIGDFRPLSAEPPTARKPG